MFLLHIFVLIIVLSLSKRKNDSRQIFQNFCESSIHFLFHFLSNLQLTGACQFSEQLKQKDLPQLHWTDLASNDSARIALGQSGAGHHLMRRLLETKDFNTNFEYLAWFLFPSNLTTVKLSTNELHDGVGQSIFEQSPFLTCVLSVKSFYICKYA